MVRNQRRDGRIRGPLTYEEKAMKRSIQDVEARWLAGREPEQRTGNEALKFSDECWAEGMRLAASQANHYQCIMDMVRWSLTG